ncbi:hypothetical protein NPIL_67051 [Nephila pilipes]|uniref:Uncharacterized protein n=1 Tax=Nephila pilipes TaxID=299642 RepID=A0A8X6MSM3_NEPPI|nr:hypothetical protein NPIL_67051 [Nephila pilipes]
MSPYTASSLRIIHLPQQIDGLGRKWSLVSRWKVSSSFQRKGLTSRRNKKGGLAATVLEQDLSGATGERFVREESDKPFWKKKKRGFNDI